MSSLTVAGCPAPPPGPVSDADQGVITLIRPPSLTPWQQRETAELSLHSTQAGRGPLPRERSGRASEKATVENPRGSVEKLSSKESVEGVKGLPEEDPKGAFTLPRITVLAPQALS